MSKLSETFLRVGAVAREWQIAAWIFVCCGCLAAQGATLVIGDSYDVTGNGSGFALGIGVNSGISPSATRLTGAVAAGLRYINTATKDVTNYTIVSNKLEVAAGVNPGRFVLSADGINSFDFASALGTGAATPSHPVV
ncbi:MAG TPA: hypothetical protein VHH88_09540, partial [Verrucomicrobiae bacterium]|nr:hypothetical protein [Verrucomicrobiae bacterium]